MAEGRGSVAGTRALNMAEQAGSKDCKKNCLLESCSFHWRGRLEKGNGEVDLGFRVADGFASF